MEACCPPCWKGTPTEEAGYLHCLPVIPAIKFNVVSLPIPFFPPLLSLSGSSFELTEGNMGNDEYDVPPCQFRPHTRCYPTYLTRVLRQPAKNHTPLQGCLHRRR